MTKRQIKIDFDTGLKARALFTMAQEHARKSEEFQQALSNLLQYEDDCSSYMGCISDAISCNDRTFVEAMKLEGYTILDA